LSIPKRLRLCFLVDQKWLAKSSRCAWKVLSAYLRQSAAFDDAVPGAAIAVHAFGDFLQFNPTCTSSPPAVAFMDGQPKVIYKSKDGRTSNTLNWVKL
jgi:hypothetical protein